MRWRRPSVTSDPRSSLRRSMIGSRDPSDEVVDQPFLQATDVEFVLRDRQVDLAIDVAHLVEGDARRPRTLLVMQTAVDRLVPAPEPAPQAVPERRSAHENGSQHRSARASVVELEVLDFADGPRVAVDDLQ